MNNAYLERDTIALVAALQGKRLDKDTKALLTELEDTIRKCIPQEQYIAFGAGVYGRGVNENEALANMARMGGSRTRFIMYRVPPGTVVNGMGGMHWPKQSLEALGMPHGGPVEVRRKGVE